MTVATARQIVGIHDSAGMIMQDVVEAVMLVVVPTMTNEEGFGAITGEVVVVVFVVEAGDIKMTVETAIISETETVVIEVRRHDQGEADLGALRGDMVEADDGK